MQREVGLDLEIVDRETEAELAAVGCTPLMDPEAEGVILFDIGGGSSEIVLLGRNEPARGGPPNPKIRAWASLPLGVVSLAERYGGVTVDGSLYEAMTAEVLAHVQRFAAEHCTGINLPAMHLLGTSGTVTTIAGLHLRLRRYDRRQVDGCWMIDSQVSAVLDELRGMSYDATCRKPLHRRRARRSGARRLRHPGGDPAHLPLHAAARRRPRPARGDAGAIDARR